MRGMSRTSGAYLNDLEHLKQSVIDILSTPIGSRVLCRDYGSNLFYLIDRPINRELITQIYASVAEALGKWEPRLKLEQVKVTEIKESHITLSLVCRYLITQQRIELEGLVI